MGQETGQKARGIPTNRAFQAEERILRSGGSQDSKGVSNWSRVDKEEC